MQKIKDNWNLIVCLLLMCIFTCIMFFYIDKKEGFHEDEIFSYSAANCKYNSIMLTYDKVDNYDKLIREKSIFKTFKNLIYYNIHPDEYDEEMSKLDEKEKVSIWKTREEAVEAVTLETTDEALDFFTTFWNATRDIHPPLFFLAVHLVSIFFLNNFSKYIIFYINLLFFLATCVVLIKIMKKLDKEKMDIPLLVLYGLSNGAISTVIFQRMYMMLTFFGVCFLYTNLKIYYNDFKLDKKLKIQLCTITVLGFLTQYYFCFYAAFLAIIMIILMAKQKKKNEIFTYIMQFVKSAIIGIALYPFSIYDIFFSYRGIDGDGSKFTFLDRMISFSNNLLSSFSMQNKIGIIACMVVVIVALIECKNKENRNMIAFFIIPVILYVVAVSKLSPYKSLRYVMNTLPIISIAIIYILDNLFKNKRLSFCVISVLAIILSLYGLKTNDINYLYRDYSNCLEVAKKFKDDKFILIDSTVFNYIAKVPEMMIYKESMVIAPEKLDELKNNSELKEENEFILSIKNSARDKKEILNSVLEYTNFTNYELLAESDKSGRCSIYRIYDK